MQKISKADTRKVFQEQRSIVADMLGITRNHAADLINYGDKGETNRRIHNGVTLSGWQFRQYVTFLEQQGFSTNTALCAARYGISPYNTRSSGRYYFLGDGLLVDHEELTNN